MLKNPREAAASRPSRATQQRIERSGRMPDEHVYNEPSKVTAKAGKVFLDGPDAVDVKLTPEAAEETADRLEEGAALAQGQRRLGKMAHRAQDD